MQDRIPLYPGRVTMTPVAGQANTFDMVRADDPTQPGTPLNKATLLKDATAALYGMGTGAVPDDVLAELGKYKQYWWKRISAVWRDAYTTLGDVTSVKTGGNDSNNATYSISYSASYSVDSSGNVTLVSPSKLSVSYTNYTAMNALKGHYFKSNISSVPGIYFVSADAPDAIRETVNTVRCVYIDGAKLIGHAQGYEYGPVELVNSSDRNAYPDSGIQDGYEYEYLGIPLDNAVTAPRIETGSYVGTGTYGQENPNTLTFEFVPKFVIFWQGSIGSSVVDVSSTNPFYWIYNGDKMFPTSSTNNYNCFVTLNGTTLTWYSPRNKDAQYNDETKEYHYVAIG